MEQNPDNERRSRFLKQTMMPGERIVRRGEFHWTYSLGAWVQALVWIGLGFGLSFALTKFGGGKDVSMTAPENRIMVIAPPLLGLFFGGIAFVKKMIRKWTTEIVLTDKRFLYKTGIFSIMAYKLNMREINYCNITQSLVGNMMNYGQIYMYTHTLDDKNIYLPPIADPHGFSTEIENLKKTAY